MCIDPKTLSAGTVVEDSNGTVGIFRPGILDGSLYYDITRVYAPIPRGMDPEKAARILAEHVEWVPLPDGPTEAHVGARVRLVSALVNDCAFQDRITAWYADGEVRLSACGDNWYPDSGDWFIHPDDVPQEPEHDPALVEYIARAVHKAAREEKPWDDLPRYVRQQFLDDAEAALTAVREYEAQR